MALLGLLGAALFLVFTALGVWQVERRAWKLDLIDRVTHRILAAPGPAPTPAQWAKVAAASDEYLPVRIAGRWWPARPLLVQATTALGAGYWVVSALAQTDGTQILVNRGFVPQEQRAKWLAESANAADGTNDGPVVIEGVLRISEPGGAFLRRNQPAEQRWYSRDVAAMAAALRLPKAAPFFVDAGIPTVSAADAPEMQPPVPGPWPRPGLTIVRFHNSHLVYAITWFGMALMTLMGIWLVARYEWRLRRP